MRKDMRAHKVKYYAWHVIYEGDVPVYQGTTDMIANARGVSNHVCRNWLARIRTGKIKKWTIVSFPENKKEREEHKRRHVNKEYRDGRMKKNIIEWISGSDIITVSFTQKRYVNKIKKLANDWPELVDIIEESENGSIYAHLPLKALKLFILPPQLKGFTKKED